MSRLTRKIAISAALLAPACGAGGGANAPAPADPSAVVTEFLARVSENDLASMGDLWGTEDGPASSSMEEQELRKRLTVIATYLAHDSYELEPQGARSTAIGQGRRSVSVLLRRAGCQAIVPFTLVSWSGQWLIENIDLAPIGNPARPCTPSRPGG